MEGEDCGGHPSCSWRVPGSGLGGVGVPKALGLVWLSRCLPVCVWRASCWAGSWGEACSALPGGPRAVGWGAACRPPHVVLTPRTCGERGVGPPVASGQGEPGPVHAIPLTTLGPGHPCRMPLGTVRAWLAAGSCGGQQTPCARGGGSGQTAAGLWEGRPRLVLPAGSAPQETSDKSVIELQQFARKNKPNLHILSKLQEEMRRLAEERVGGGPGPRGL